MSNHILGIKFGLCALIAVLVSACSSGGGDTSSTPEDGDSNTPALDGDIGPQEDGDLDEEVDLDDTTEAEFADNTVSAEFGPSGGLLEHPDGCSVFIPAGALSETVTLSIRPVNVTLPGKFWPMSPACEFGPVGLQLHDNARLNISYQGYSFPENRYPHQLEMVQQNPDDAQEWQSLTIFLDEYSKKVEGNTRILGLASLMVRVTVDDTDGDEDLDDVEIICEDREIECRNNESGNGQLYKCVDGVRWQLQDNCVQRDPCDLTNRLFVACLDDTACPDEFGIVDGDLSCEEEVEDEELDEEEVELCQDDRYDPNGTDNDTRPTATPVDPDGQMEDLILCPGTRDTYSFEVNAGSEIVGEIFFTHNEGDLDLRLYRSNGSLISTGQTQTDNERVTYITSTSGTYYLEVRGKHDGDGAGYDLSVRLDGGGACTDDAYDLLGNDDVYAAQQLGAENQTFNNLVICDGDPDWYKFTLLAHKLFVATLSISVDSPVDVTLRLTDQWATNTLDELTVNTSQDIRFEVPIDTTDVYALLVDLPQGQRMDYSLTLNQEELPTEDGDLEEIAQAPSPLAGEVIFTEILRNPSGPNDAQREWFELENVGSDEVDLYDCHYGDSTQNWNVIEESLTLAPGERVVIARDADNITILPDAVWTGFALQNDGEESLSLHCNYVLIDTVTFGGTNWHNPTGASLQLSRDHKNASDNDSYDAWCASTTSFGDGADLGTPGAENELCGVVNPYVPPTVAQPVAGEVLVSEFMVLPTGISDTNGQWIELKNVSDHSVNLQGCRYGNAGTLAWQDLMSRMVLEPDEAVLFAANEEPTQNGGLDPDHRFTTTRLLFNRVTDTIRLQCSGTDIDRVDYDLGEWEISSGHAAQLDLDITDASLNDEGSSWCNAQTAYFGGNYGTPGSPNEVCVSEMEDGDMELDDEFEEEAELEESGQPWPQAGELVITEIMVLPAASGVSTGQWFEMTSVADHTVDLLGCEIADGVNIRWKTIDHYLYVSQDQAIVFARSADVEENGGLTPVHSTFEFELGSFGDKVRMRCGGTLIDEVEYESSWGVASGYSLSLDFFQTDATANDNYENWCAARSNYNSMDYGTPASLNPGCD